MVLKRQIGFLTAFFVQQLVLELCIITVAALPGLLKLVRTSNVHLHFSRQTHRFCSRKRLIDIHSPPSSLPVPSSFDSRERQHGFASLILRPARLAFHFDRRLFNSKIHGLHQSFGHRPQSHLHRLRSSLRLPHMPRQSVLSIPVHVCVRRSAYSRVLTKIVPACHGRNFLLHSHLPPVVAPSLVNPTFLH